MKNDGGPAFPVWNDPGSRDAYCGALTCGGMTLRDYFAAAVLPSICKLHSSLSEGALEAEIIQEGLTDSYQLMARNSYRLADAMIAERAKGTGNG